jgi:hypothetical protein
VARERTENFIRRAKNRERKKKKVLNDLGKIKKQSDERGGERTKTKKRRKRKQKIS